MIGSFSSLLLKRGLSLNLARKIAIGISVSVMPCLLFVPISSNLLVIVPFAIGYFGQQAWSTLIMTLPADLFPRSAVGAVAGLVGFGGAMGGIAFGELAGQMLKHGTGYAPIFGLAGTLHILSFFVILLFIRNVRPLAFEGWHHKSVDLSHRGA
jgi:ACS family hexuronate transporter-like MFS transporter